MAVVRRPILRLAFVAAFDRPSAPIQEPKPGKHAKSKQRGRIGGLGKALVFGEGPAAVLVHRTFPGVVLGALGIPRLIDAASSGHHSYFAHCA